MIAINNSFGFSEFLAALALLLIIFSVSDFKYHLRLNLTFIKFKQVALIVSLLIGFLILCVDVWFYYRLPIIKFLNDQFLLKAILASVFFGCISIVMLITIIKPPIFNRYNAKAFAREIHGVILSGNEHELTVLTAELMRSIDKIIDFAAKAESLKDDVDKRNISNLSHRANWFANDIILLFGDRRFCKVIAAQKPRFAVLFFNKLESLGDQNLPVSTFASNISAEFFKNKNSALYQEEDGYDTGYFGYVKPISEALFGYYPLIESLSKTGRTTLTFSYLDFNSFDSEAADVYVRSALLFSESYLKHTHGQMHSYVWHQIVSNVENLSSEIYKINEIEFDYWNTTEHKKFEASVKIVKEVLAVLNRHSIKPVNNGHPNNSSRCPYDRLARLFLKIIFNAAKVDRPDFRTWSVQHNSTWSEIFRFNDTTEIRIFRRKLTRLIYSEIKRMDAFPNFKGARILGFCLNVLGLSLRDRHTGHRKEEYPLQSFVIRWTEKNYARLVANNPKVAAACLQGKMTYDEEKHKIIATFSNETGKNPKTSELQIEPLENG